MISTFHKFLGWLGFNYCQECGRHLVFLYEHGYDHLEVWGCPVHDKKEVDRWTKINKKLV
jgi:hypothetical protein